jgi:hypothetical protein
MTAIFFWNLLAKSSIQEFQSEVEKQLALAQSTYERLNSDSLISWYCKPFRLHGLSLTVNLKIPYKKHLYEKFSLPEFKNEGETQIQMMPHVTPELLDIFVEDLRKEILLELLAKGPK